jgi:hypothetical protein
MEFLTISTFEKTGTQIEAELWATPGWFKLTQCFLYDNNPYISKMDLKISDDGSYIEYHIIWHNEEAYNAWFDEWKSVHNDIKPKVINNLKSRGITYTLFWPSSDVEPPPDDITVSLESFTTKLVS